MAGLTNEDKKLNFFSEKRWNLLKMRGVALFAALAYPVWSPVFTSIFPEAYDPFFERILATLPCWLVVALSFRKEMKEERLEPFFNVMAFGLTYHVFFLVYKNDLSISYIIGAYCMFFATGAALSSFRVMLGYFASCLLITACLYPVNHEAVFLVLGILCSGAISMISLNSTHRLLDHLRSSRKQVESVAESLDNTLNALGQGFFSFDMNGICRSAYSKACLTLLETDPSGQSVFDVLRMPQANRTFHTDFLAFAFDSSGKFDLFADMMPKSFPHSQGRMIALEFRPVEKDGLLTEVLVVATDETALLRASQDAEAERNHMRMVATIVKEKRFFTMFLQSFRKEILQFTQSTPSIHQAADFRRFLHSIKGASSVFHMLSFASGIHEMETAWAIELTEVEILSLMQTQAVELNGKMNDFLREHDYLFGAGSQAVRVVEIGLDELLRLMRHPEFTSAPVEIRQTLVKAALVPIVNYFTSFSDLAQKIAVTQRKKLAAVEFVNGELPVFPEAYQALLTSFVHVFRNAVDHGLESREERRMAGKDETGRITVQFSMEADSQGSWLTIQVRDDGRGLDPAKIREKLPATSIDLTDSEVMQMIFEPSFTTRDSVSELSGRGVGLDALKVAITELGGSVNVSSVEGQFTLIEVRVPYIEPATHLSRSLTLAS
jgi:two-component system, chemotaxis family, sensor kinase CheA